MDVSILTPGSRAWAAALDAFAYDVYHLPGYTQLAAQHEGGRAVAFLARDGEGALLVPLLLKEAPGTPEMGGVSLYDAASPYGYSGVLLNEPGAADDRFMKSALAHLWAELACQNAVTLFLRLHPFLEIPLGFLTDRGRVVEHGLTVGIPLEGDVEEILAQFRKGHRRVMRKAQREAHEVSITSSTERLDQFVRLYYENMDRLGAAEYYYFSYDYFETMFEVLAGRVFLAFLDIDGELAQVDLLTEVNGIVQTHLGAANAAYLHLSPSVLLTYYECLWARDRGDRVIHLGGGLGGQEDSLYQFKAGFSQTRFAFRTFRAIVDQERFERLTSAQAERCLPTDDVLGGYFPPYRSPALCWE
jgi:hypothetical protein